LDTSFAAESREASPVSIQLARGFLLASLPGELQEDGWRRFQTDLLERIRETAALGVILDLSGVDVLDSLDFEAIRRSVAMATLMGARTVVAGFRPGVVSSLIGMDLDLDSLEAVATTDDAFELLAPDRSSDVPPEIEPDEDGDSDPDSE
jgi:rsbT antagonist protein RsbS